MRSGKTFHFHACANALGGILDTPPHTCLPSQASVSLSESGGNASTQAGAFDHHNVVSCRSTFTRVSGKKHDSRGGWTSQTTSVIEGLNILHVITADRIVAQITVDHPDDGRPSRYCFAGSHFYGLRVAGKDVNLSLNSDLLGAVPQGATKPVDLEWKTFISLGEKQATDLSGLTNASQWAVDRMQWMLPANKPQDNGYVLCSLVDDVTGAAIGSSFGHYLDIPDIGKVFLGELVAYRHSVQLTMLRVQLGCHVNGEVSSAMASNNGGCRPPC